MIRRAAVACAGATVLHAGAASAQETAAPPPERPALLMSRFDEDWRSLCDPTRRATSLDRLKCRRLGEGGPTLTLGGEVRERFETARNPTFGFDGAGRDEVLLHRVLLHADVRWADSARVFVQFGHHLATERAFGRAPTDVDGLDLQQGFVDLSATLGKGAEGTVRAGRQEMSFGSARLVSTRESPNVRRSFDGARFYAVGEGWRLDAFSVRPVQPDPGVFDDHSDRDTAVWGLYGSGLRGPDKLGLLDLYYFGYQADDAAFAQGAGRERRHSIGARLFGERSGFDWDLEAVHQFGRFGDAEIRAWTVASDTGFSFAGLPWRPRAGLKADVASGDGNLEDQSLGTFNALFPKFPYFTEANVVAPANIIDLQPSLTMSPIDALEVVLGWNVLWKHRVADAFYAPPLTPIQNTTGEGRFVGHQASVSTAWKAAPSVTLSGSFVRFWPGDRLRRAAGRSGAFLSLSAAFKF